MPRSPWTSSDGGEVLVSGKRDGKFLVITMSNPVAAGSERAKSGNKMAMDNIRQRFELAYARGATGQGATGKRTTVDVDDSGDSYTVTLRFPHDEGRES